MSTQRVVVFPNNLLLHVNKRDVVGNIVSAYVENGHWDLCADDTEILCMEPNNSFVRNRYPFKGWTEIIIPDDVRGDYNFIIEWARTEYDNDTVYKESEGDAE